MIITLLQPFSRGESPRHSPTRKSLRPRPRPCSGSPTKSLACRLVKRWRLSRGTLDRASEAVGHKEERRGKNMDYRLLQSTQAEMGGQKRSTLAAGRSSTRGQQQPRGSFSIGKAPSNYSKPSVSPHRLHHAYQWKRYLFLGPF